MPAIRNVHRRTIDASAEKVGALLDQLGSDSDRLWPKQYWPPIRFDRPLAVGADGGHGPIRYRVTAYEPGRRVRCTFDPRMGVDGYHEAVVEAIGSDRCVLRHELQGQASASMYVRWTFIIRCFHDALIEDLLDNAERAATGTVLHPARWSAWVRLLRRLPLRIRPPAPTPASVR
jgi:hypothetical protein